MKKTGLLCLLLVAAALFPGLSVSYAQEQLQYVRIDAAEQDPIFIALEATPHVEMSGQEVVVTTDEVTISIPLAARAHFTFTATSGVASPEEENITVRYAAHTLTVSGLAPGTQLTVYSTSGSLMAISQASEDGTVVISTQGWPANVYIVKSEKLTSKLIIK